MLRHLHAVVGSCTSSFHWLDGSGRPDSHFDEPPYLPDIARLAFGNVDGAPKLPTLSPHWPAGSRRGAVRRTPLPARFHDSDAYRRLWLPRGIHHALEAVVEDGRRPLGVLVLYRGPRDEDFASSDIATLSGLLPLFARACQGSAPYDGERVSVSPPAFAVMGMDGVIRQGSPDARLMFALALHPCLNQRSCGRGCTRSDSGVAMQLQSICAALSGGPSQSTTLRIRNRWGQFTLRAQALNPLSGAAAPQVGVMLDHAVPMPVAVEQALQNSELSLRQRELCLLLASGSTYAAAGRRMGITEQTAISYARVVFGKLGARSRDDLLHRLLQPM